MRFLLASEPQLGNWHQKWSITERAVVEADELGYWGFALPDEYMWMPDTVPKDINPDHTVDAWIALSYLAARTHRIKLGTFVTPIPLRPPAVLAKMVSTLDVLSGGRVFLGVGAGYSQRDFDGYGEWSEPRVRVDKTREALELMIKLWTQKQVSFDGRYYKAKDAILEPKTIQKPYPPLLFGGFKPRMLKLAGKYADIVNDPPPWTKIDPAVLRATVEEEAKRQGRAGKISYIFGAYEEKYNSKGYIDQIEEARRIGCDPILVLFPHDYLESMRSFGKEVIPSFNS